MKPPKLIRNWSGGDGSEIEAEPVVIPSEQIDELVLWKRQYELKLDLYGDTVASSDRQSALIELAAAGDRTIAAFLVGELRAESADLEWLASVVAAAELTNFTESDDRAFVQVGLQSAVQKFVKTRDARWAPVTWAAIRVHSSMLTPDKAGVLASYLAISGDIETRIVSLQAIQNIFHAAPPRDQLPLDTLRDAVAAVAAMAIGPHEPTPGDEAALAEEAVLGLAALGDPRLVDYINRIAQYGQRWLTRQVRIGLQEITNRWAKSAPDSLSRPAVDRITICTHLLRVQEV